VPLIEREPLAAGCRIEHSDYIRPFWRAPYQRCIDSVPNGQQVVILDADSVVVETDRNWIVPPRAQQGSWNREAARITGLFGPPVRTTNAAVNLAADVARSDAMLRSYCVAWRGPDSVEVVLRLEPRKDVGPPSLEEPWQLHRDSRYGPLPDAVACGLR
jgi:hypothetical protein